jgi:fermentation-respiration switch protein FrsA (DUF1100 family)
MYQAAGGKIGRNVDPGFEHHAVATDRPISHGIAAIGLKPGAWLKIDGLVLRTFQAPWQGEIVVAQTPMTIEIA